MTGIAIAHVGAVASSQPLGVSPGPAAYAAAVLADAPELFVVLSSTSPADTSGHGHTVTAGGGTPTTTSDAFWGTVFNGGSCYFDTNAVYSVPALTLEAVFNASTYGGGPYKALISGYQGDDNWILTLDTGGTSIFVYPHPGYNVSITNSAWHHVAATYDGTSLRIYLDGVLSTTYGGASGRPPKSADNLEIGSYQHGNTFTGKLASVTTYPTCLSAGRVAAHAAAAGF